MSITDDDSGSPFTVNANYPADQNYTAATAAPTPSVTVTDDSSGEVTGDSLKFTAAVSGPGSGSVSPTGTVSWLVTGPGSPTCSDSTLSSGVATCTISHVVPGAYAATASYSGDGNYSGSSGSDTTTTVAPAPLTVTASSASMTYGGDPPAITACYSGFVNGDTAPPSPPSRRARPRPRLEPGRQLRTSCSGAADPNYTFSYVVGSVQVDPASADHHGLDLHDHLRQYSAPTITASYSRVRERRHGGHADHGPDLLDHGHRLEPGRQLRPPARARPTRTTRSATSPARCGHPGAR